MSLRCLLSIILAPRYTVWLTDGCVTPSLLALCAPVRMGNLASSLLRLSQWIKKRHGDETIIDLMREIAWFLEWNGDLALAELPDMQREICRWRRIWPIEKARSILALRSLQMSRRILELSGLLIQTASEQNSPAS